MNVQIFMHPTAPDPAEMGPVVFWEGHTKPRGGMWTSSFDEELLSGWIDWSQSADFGADYQQVWAMVPDPHARILTITSPAMFCEMIDRYPIHVYSSGMTYPWRDGPEWTWDFVAMSKDFDAFRLTDDVQSQMRHIGFGGFADYSNKTPAGRIARDSSDWDCESTVWFRWMFESAHLIQRKFRVKDADYEAAPSIGRRWKKRIAEAVA